MKNELEEIFGEQDQSEFDLIHSLDDLENVTDEVSTRYVKPVKHKKTNNKNIIFPNAQDLVSKIDMKANEDVFCFVSGDFVFGDFLIAFLEHHDICAEKLTISTLSFDNYNIDGLRHMMDNGYINNINFLISDYFYSHERHKKVKYLYDKLDVDNRLQVGVCRTHTKMTTILTDRGNKIVMHGSANLRSSDNIEQFKIEFNEELYDFCEDFNTKLINKFKSINKSLTNKKVKEIWKQV